MWGSVPRTKNPNPRNLSTRKPPGAVEMVPWLVTLAAVSDKHSVPRTAPAAHSHLSPPAIDGSDASGLLDTLPWCAHRHTNQVASQLCYYIPIITVPWRWRQES